MITVVSFMVHGREFRNSRACVVGFTVVSSYIGDIDVMGYFYDSGVAECPEHFACEERFACPGCLQWGD